ncbi:type III secretion system export apparatus subunit SctU [Undibacterium sp. TS12]|uniref:type III secretion system export apparatus subunit SctU n=1 Tax=Undibacterium sp. TS12 TaxID=2908202 RepID=UPI001F4D10F0|nr:type III secretion system export apparatus subunit SctU [Undibacterium sp. TS12]MCH8621959.1 type III secretion system export apparatus subunit SctU [Undibacterium sp. TS12]
MSEEKNEKPTDKKLEDARKKGQVAVSRDLAKLISLVAVMELAFLTEPLWRAAMMTLLETSVTTIGLPFEQAADTVMQAAVSLLFLIFFVFFLVCTVIGMFAYWGQIGVLCASEVLSPKFEKIDPVNGMKQLFSKKKLMELVLSLIKAGLIGLLAYSQIRQNLPDIVQLSAGNPLHIYFGFFSLVRSTFHVLVVLFLMIGLLDFAMQKYLHVESLKMDMEEIKREYKESEGDPLVKGMRKQLARQWASEAPVSKTSEANAVVVNPTHFAIAILFDESTPVPKVLAKGKDEVARAMIARAHECGIPVIRHVWLARTLYCACKMNSLVPRSSYEAVAMVYAAIRELMHDKNAVLELESLGQASAQYQQ